MLDVLDLSFDYQDKSLLTEVRFSLAAGQVLHLKGANGAGKTTLLKLLAGLFEPQSGEICYAGKPISEDLRTYQEELCYVGHKVGINPLLTVKENCFFDLHSGRHTLDLEDLLKSFGLQGLEDEYCHYLSAGQRRRVGLLRIAMTKARLWLLDEPLVALDTEGIATLMTYLEQHLAQGGMIVLTSHQNLPFNRTCQEYSL